MKLNNNKKEQEQILETMSNLGFDLNWEELKGADHLFDGEQIIFEGNDWTIFLVVENNEITDIDYLPFPERESQWVKGARNE